MKSEVVSPAEDAKPSPDAAESSLVASSECRSEVSAPEQPDDLDWLSYLEYDSLDFKMFSPLHSQVQSELGSSFNEFQSGPSELFGSHNGANIQTQYGTNNNAADEYMSEFLDTLLEVPYEFPEKKELVAQPMPEQIRYEPHNLVDTRNKINTYASTGIKVRSRQAQAPRCAEQFAMQGEASRRLRLQVNLNSGKSETDDTQQYIKKEDKDTARESMTKKCGNFIKSNSRTGLIFEKIAAMGGSYRGLVRAGVVAVVFVMSVCSLTAKFR
jgi:hypothetical protein